MESRDDIPPARITSLRCEEVRATEVVLAWTAPGDDGMDGQASSYDLRYSLSTISEANWDSMTQVPGEPAPIWAWGHQRFTVAGLDSGRIYYFGMKSADKVPNWSELSNMVIGDKEPPLVVITEPSAQASITGRAVISSAASDNHEITRVEFYVDRCLRNCDSIAPWSYEWDCSVIADSTRHVLRTIAYDVAGNATFSEPITVLVRSTFTDVCEPEVAVRFGQYDHYVSTCHDLTVSVTDESSGVDWDSVFIDIYDMTGSDTLWVYRLLHTWTGDFLEYGEVPCGTEESIAPLCPEENLLPAGRRYRLLVYDGTKTREFDEACSCEYYRYDYERHGVPDLSGNHTEVVEEEIVVLPDYGPY